MDVEVLSVEPLRFVDGPSVAEKILGAEAAPTPTVTPMPTYFVMVRRVRERHTAPVGMAPAPA